MIEQSSSYTPGPWSAERSDPGRFQVATVESIGIYSTHVEWGGGAAGAPEADASLIAAAPELLAALIEMEREKADYMTRNHLGDPAQEHTNKMARAAIARAIGVRSTTTEGRGPGGRRARWRSHAPRRAVMTTPHVHSELIKAWADGATIQVRYGLAGPATEWLDDYSPQWALGATYRLKPKPVTVRYRVALFLNAGKTPATFTADDDQEAALHESHHAFVRWLTDWQEVEA